ncbi:MULTISPECIES: hypothetical protein [Xenorhabdus]|uniref:phage baseplate plug family protein n=1 Tax=Xenorhabdus TaxID=626 RepID=UPI00064B346C|nr:MULTISPECIES: hypothetical protein [Xenorhabdus]KLU14537.1 hypothetical protein AAY47_15900 [Xenorhabdus griffiniae]KOP33328.1 hypothetical protein AFK69_10180 [Xenorhabdus sp. GDc328]WFQ80738.1 hypothetical protein PXH59_06375 [Xenorhabdus sp. SF857]
MITEIPLEKIPNQTLSFFLESDNYDLTLETRLDNLFATVKKNGEYLVCNRVCRNMTYICQWLVFSDIEGNTDPEYSQLGSRYRLVWINGF